MFIKCRLNKYWPGFDDIYLYDTISKFLIVLEQDQYIPIVNYTMPCSLIVAIKAGYFPVSVLTRQQFKTSYPLLWNRYYEKEKK